MAKTFKDRHDPRQTNRSSKLYHGFGPNPRRIKVERQRAAELERAQESSVEGTESSVFVSLPQRPRMGAWSSDMADAWL